MTYCCCIWSVQLSQLFHNVLWYENKSMKASLPPNTHIFIFMASQGVPPASQSWESPISLPIPVVRHGPTYQPHIPQIYSPHPYGYSHANPHYNGQSRLYAYGTQQTTQTPLPAAPPDVKHPRQVTSEETKPRQNSKAVARRPHTSTWKGHMSGSQHWSTQDLIALAHYVEGDVPLRMYVWMQIEGLYNKDYAILNNWQKHMWDNMQDKWYKVSNTAMNVHHMTLTCCSYRS